MQWFRRHPDLSSVVLVVVLLGVVYPLKEDIRGRREAQQLARTSPLVNMRVGEEVLSWTMGWAIAGFRQVGVTIAWLELQEANERRDWFELRMLCDWITYLQPEFDSIWSFNSWNLAYNISVKATTPEEGWKWVQEGMRVARRGIRRKPTASVRYFDLARIYQHQCGAMASDPTSRGSFYKQKVIETTGVHPYVNAIDVMKRAWNIDRCGRWSRAAMIPHAWKSLAEETAVDGDYKGAMRYRRKAIEWFREVSAEDAYPSYKSMAEKEIRNLRIRMRAQDAENEAAEAAAQARKAREAGDIEEAQRLTEREMMLVDSAWKAWSEAFDTDQYSKETLAKFKKLIARYEKAIDAHKRAIATGGDADMVAPHRHRLDELRERITDRWLSLAKYHREDEGIDKAFEQLADRHGRLVAAAEEAGDLDEAYRQAMSLGAVSTELFKRPSDLPGELKTIRTAAETQQALAERLRGKDNTEQSERLVLESAEAHRLMFSEGHESPRGVENLQWALKYYQKLETDISADLLVSAFKQVNLHKVLLRVTQDRAAYEAALSDIRSRVVALGLLEAEQEKSGDSSSLQAGERLLRELDAELRRRGRAEAADDVKAESAGLHEKLGTDTEGDIPAEEVLKLIGIAMRGERSVGFQLLGNLTKQIDIRMALMEADVDAEAHAQALKDIASRCVDVALWEKEHGVSSQIRWRAVAEGLYTYFLKKNPSDEEAHEGMERLEGEQDEPRPAVRPRKEAPADVGATWVVWFFFASPVIMGLVIAYFVRRRRIRSFTRGGR